MTNETQFDNANSLELAAPGADGGRLYLAYCWAVCPSSPSVPDGVEMQFERIDREQASDHAELA